MATMGSSFTSIDHIGLFCPVDMLDTEVKFFEAALAPLEIKEHFRLMPLVSAMGDNPKKPWFWISALGGDRKPIETPRTPIHLAFKAQNENQVDEFYKAAIAAGGKDNGAPGIRSHYHPGYYAAFIVTPAGTANLEVVFHGAAPASKE